MIINSNTQIVGVQTPAVKYAAENLRRDIQKVCNKTEVFGCQIVLEEQALEKECFCIRKRENSMVIQASDELGFIYGIYEISRTFLGVHAFLFWNAQEFVCK